MRAKVQKASIKMETDHDILIKLVERVKDNQLTVLEKIEDVKSKVQEVSDGITIQVTDHERRIQSIERIHQVVQPEKSFADLQTVILKQNNFQLTWKLIVGIAAGVGGLVGFVISALIGILNLLSKH